MPRGPTVTGSATIAAGATRMICRMGTVSLFDMKGVKRDEPLRGAARRVDCICGTTLSLALTPRSTTPARIGV